MFLGEIFQIKTQTIDGWPNLTQPELLKIAIFSSSGQKFLTQTHHEYDAIVH